MSTYLVTGAAGFIGSHIAEKLVSDGHTVRVLDNLSTGKRENLRVLGDGVPCSSTKPLVGHTLGASGALEAAFCWLVLTHCAAGSLCLPPHRFDGQVDPDLPRLSLVGEGARIEATGRAALMTNSFGFGGSNCTLVLGGRRG